MDIPWQTIGPGSGWGIVVLGIVGIFRGWLTPKPAVDRLEHEINEWRAESRIKDAQIAEKDRQLAELAEVGKTVDAIMRSIHRNARSGDRQSHEESP